MAAKTTTLNAKNLEALGAPRLAELLIEISTGSAANKRRLRMELAGNHSGAEIAREVRKRLTSIARSRTFINWRRVKAVTKDLETQRKTIVDVVAPDDPKEALELAWQFLALADPVFERSADGSGSIIQSFHQACADAGVIAGSPGVEKDALADKIFAAVQNNDYGQYDPLIAAMAPTLGKDGLERLKALFVQWSREPEDKVAQGHRQVIGWSSKGPIYENQVDGNHQELTVRIALQEIADAQGDVDAYIAQQPEKTRKSPLVATDIARRLLSAGRAAEALETLDAVDTRSRVDAPIEWQLARVEVLEALGRADEAQADRWTWFEQSLNDVHLRAFIRRLPDFDDMEAEEKAFAYVQAFPEVHRALAFFLRWPAMAEAAKLVLKRKAELDGDLYDLMTPAAEALAEKHPLAATIVLRSMIDFTLENARSSRYKHAARHLVRCASLAPHIADFAGLGSHDAYVAGLKSRHGHKRGFRSLAP
ncbi:DUF6880 family protein [Neorhizobium galegae]|uniref:DUF6880 family protein n=1 Tax=Neorhizobium galegae TaxID=399 RepID=UPI000622490F|nr:DUF6880 family protein [Neorhizobium galegae]CDZ58715.1 Hypothetical protein NGAL_HAMBI2566_31290 [Neorhizobium galegae bv. orientalis]KAB1121438.1 hypothetical protein F4V90_25245 [Neorhizobium galegae]MCQ1570556.1 hypothetical protein [Neorhizobium galegae]MCQ1809208.1 hypothetical protein [Neorhizobium galegae]CDZ63950.1 Hypothetical protein NGAL_HAMBI2605_27290 [Neorhizobium galegae bv. orientalis]